MKKSNEEIEKKKKSNKYWDFETCKEEALKYDKKSNYIKCQTFTKNNGLYEEITIDGSVYGDRYNRLVYVYEFIDNHCYIGLTLDYKSRYNSHMRKGPIYKHMSETNLIPKYIILSDYIDVGDAQELEHNTKLKYIEEGWNVLNIGTTGRGVGSIGGLSESIWNINTCKDEALKYKTRKDFEDSNGTAYNFCLKYNIMDDVCGHMIPRYLIYWYVKENCFNVAKKCRDINHFKSKYENTAYLSCMNNNWLNELVFNEKEKAKVIYNKDIVYEKASKCRNFSHFKTIITAYNMAIENDWMDEIFELYFDISYNFKSCKKEALKYDNIEDFENKSKKYFNTSKAYSWLPTITTHIKYDNIYYLKYLEICAKKYKNLDDFKIDNIELYKDIEKFNLLDDFIQKYWNIKEKIFISKWDDYNKCLEEAMKYKTRTEFVHKSEKCVEISKKNGWYEEICSHMTVFQKPHNYWTKERCKEEALKYDRIVNFQQNCGGAYNKALFNKWLEDISSHMIERNGGVKGYWTKENCHKISINYKSRTRFLKEYSPVYRIAEKNNWLDEICSHIPKREPIKPKNYWTKELVYQEALKYDKKSDFEKGSLTAYHLMVKNCWIEEMTSHMKVYKNKKALN